MKLSKTAIKQLYGKHIYILPDTQADPPSQAVALSPDLFRKGAAVTWKMKPNAQIVLILSQDEFANATLTSLLKGLIQQVQIPTSQVGFGVMPSDCLSLSLENMPVKIGVVWGLTRIKSCHSVNLPNQDLLVLPSLQTILEDKALQDEATEKLRQMKFLLSSS